MNIFKEEYDKSSFVNYSDFLEQKLVEEREKTKKLDKILDNINYQFLGRFVFPPIKNYTPTDTDKQSIIVELDKWAEIN